MAVRTRFFEHLFVFWFAALPCLSSSLAFAQGGAEDDSFLQGLAQQHQQIIQSQQSLPTWLQTQPSALDPTLARLLGTGTAGQDPTIDANNGQNHRHPADRWLFVSFGMPAQELLAAAREAAESQAVLVFRGVDANGNTGTLGLRLANVVKAIKPTPGAIIDPLLFKRFAITAVPAQVISDAQGQVRRAQGLPGFAWLARQDVGDAGQKGPVYAIQEPDLLEEIQRRIQTTDWAQQKQQALANFWQGQGQGLDLPNAKSNRERVFDPSLTVTQNIYHPDGRLIAQKGQRLNPQTLMPMRHVYIIFDASQPAQVSLAKQLGKQAARNKKPVVFLFSKLNPEKGWAHYNTLAANMGAPVYQLNTALLKRFQIQALPTVIEGRGDKLSIKEIGYEEP